MRFVFLGTAEFGIPALEALLKSGHECCGVVTNPPKPAGRGLKVKPSPVHFFCEERGIGPVFAPESLKDEQFLEQLRGLNADIFVVVAFSILPEILFSIPPKGTFNIHAALLPKFRGPAPIHRAVETGASETGVTLFRIDRGVDTGNILVQLKCAVSEDDTTPSLYERLSLLGADAVCQGFTLIEQGGETYTAQDHSQATKAPLLKKEEAQICWRDSAQTIFNRVRAFIPFPGTYTDLDGKRIGVEWGCARDEQSGKKPGTIISVSSSGIDVACGSGIFTITQIKPAGKRAMSVRDFINGSTVQEGTILE